MFRLTALAITLLTCISIKAQLISWSTENKYASPTNPHYWKNKEIAQKGYWQQDVYYQISAKLDEEKETIEGKEILYYTNNSPHALNQLFFHLYQNAVQPGSLVDELYNANKVIHQFGKYEEKGLGTTIAYVKINDEEVAFTIDYTLMQIKLPQAIESGKTTKIEIAFTTYFDRGSIRRRMKVYDHHGFKHFNGVHWYPRIVVYDKKFSWAAQQHMEHEFYGDFGQYDVELSLPNHYICEATGTNLNRYELLPNEIWNKLQITNFKNKKVGEAPSTIIQPDGSYKTWKFHAINVHDFAWTADPTYRIAIEKYGDIECIALAQENNAAGWQPTAAFLRDVVKTYSTDFGEYVYPKIVAADANDGMEYPMLTLDGGMYPSHRGLIAHEVGHNWFFGMLGSNETYRAALDEGFTQFLTAWSLKKLSKPETHASIDYGSVYGGYINAAFNGEEATLNTHSDDFNGATGHGGGYGQVYYKTATMLYNLQYVLGDELFSKAMKHYVSEWKIAHPYLEDFKNAITEIAQTDLNWFFDQWFDTKKTIDYGIGKIKNKSSGSSVIIKRKGTMIMPIDLKITTKSGETIQKTIPVSYFAKQGSNAAKPWIGWADLRKTYTLQFDKNIHIKNVEIDPSGRLTDINHLNNTARKKIAINFDLGNGKNAYYKNKYELQWSPCIAYNHLDGIKVGLQSNGQYMNQKHVFQSNVWYATQMYAHDERITPYLFSYLINYSHVVKPSLTVKAKSAFISGINLNSATLEKKFSAQKIYSIEVRYLQLHSSDYLQPYFDMQGYKFGYLETQKWWSSKLNFSAILNRTQYYNAHNNTGSIKVQLRLSMPWSDADYGIINTTWLNTKNINKTVLKTRLFLFGSRFVGNGGAESVLYAQGANPEELWENNITRNLGALRIQEPNLIANNLGQNLHLGGGLNMRGFIGYMLPIITASGSIIGMRSNNGFSFNTELEFGKLFSIKPKQRFLHINPYFFGDLGWMVFPYQETVVHTNLLADAGLGFAFTFQNWYKLFMLKNKFILKRPILNSYKPITIRIDFPFLRNAVHTTEEYFAPRWLIGINRAF